MIVGRTGLRSSRCHSILQPSTNKPKEEERRKDVLLRKPRAPKLGVDAHGALGQDAEQARDPVDGTQERRGPHVFPVQLW